jgi:HNH endonuclease
MITHAQPTLSSAAASTHGAASPSLELCDARRARDALKLLLRKEQAATADFLVALADLDLRRGWEALGHANLFAFLIAELGLSRSAAYYRRGAAELLQVFPEVIGPLREGRLCLSTIGELAKVLTEENRAVVTPRFFGLSAREAQELVAELQPRHVPSTRMVVTTVLDRPVELALITQPLLTLPLMTAAAPATGVDPNVVPPSRFPTSGIADGGGTDGGVGRLADKRDEIVPLTANLRRVHFNVGKQVLKKLMAARDGLSHSIRGATMEQVLEVALDLLLEKQARARGQVKKPRTTLAAAAPRAEDHVDVAAETRGEAPLVLQDGLVAAAPASQLSSPSLVLLPTHPPTAAPPHRRTGPRESIPAAVRRGVWARDAGRCSWPLDGGGCCGSTHRLELDHIIPWAEWGPSTVENLRVVCGRHNALAARQIFGARCVERYGRGE